MSSSKNLPPNMYMPVSFARKKQKTQHVTKQDSIIAPAADVTRHISCTITKQRLHTNPAQDAPFQHDLSLSTLVPETA